MDYEMSTKEAAWRLTALLVAVFVLGGAVAWAITSHGGVESDYNITWFYPDGTTAVLKGKSAGSLSDLFTGKYVDIGYGTKTFVPDAPPIPGD